MKSIAVLHKSILVLTFAVAGGASASADVIADWTFETSVPVTAGPFSPEMGAGAASGFHSTASTYSAPAGNGSAHSFSSTNWSISDYYQFTLSTSNFNDIAVSWDQTSSGTGPRDFALEYSTDGTHFTQFSSYQALVNGSPNVAWTSTGTRNAGYTLSFDLSAIDALTNQSSVTFRLVDLDTTSANGGTVGTAGTDRVDNFLVTGDLTAIPEPATYGFGAVVVAAAALHRRRRVLTALA